MQSISRPALRVAIGGALRLPSSAAAHRPRRLLARRASPVCLAAQRGAVELLLDKVPGEGQVLSARLDPDVRQRAELGEIRPVRGWGLQLPMAPLPAVCLATQPHIPFPHANASARLPVQPSRHAAGGSQWVTWLPPPVCG